MRENAIHLLFDERLYNEDFQTLIEAYSLKDSMLVRRILERIAQLGKPVPTKMFRMFSLQVGEHEEKRRLSVPLGKVVYNTEWFALCNLLLEVAFDEKPQGLWKEDKILIEEQKYLPESVNERFNVRLKEMVEKSMQKRPEYEVELKELLEMVTLTRKLVFTKGGALSMSSSVREAWEKLCQKSQWKDYIENPTIHCLALDAKEVSLCDNLVSQQVPSAGFWARIVEVYMV